MTNNKDIYQKDERGRYIHDYVERQKMIAQRLQDGTYDNYDPTTGKHINDEE